MSHHPNGWAPPYHAPHYPNGNGQDLSKGKLPVGIVVGALFAVSIAGWTARDVLAGFQMKEKTVNDRLDGVDRRLSNIENSLGELVAAKRREPFGTWITEAKRAP